MPAPKPTIRLNVEISPEAKQNVSAFVDDLKRKIRDRETTHGPDDAEVKKHRAVLETLQKIGSQQERTTRYTREFKNELGGITNALRNLNVLGGPGGAAAGSMIGAGGALLTAGGIGAVVAAVGAVVGMAMKMGLEFERTSTRAAQTLTIGSQNFRANYDAIRSASFTAGEPYGIGVHEMANAISAYGISRGATGRQAAAAGRGIARYARGYGLDPTQLAGMVGTFSATTNEDFDVTANALFGGAEQAGPLGRRITEFIATATNTLSALQFNDTSRNYGAEDASSLVRNIARLGGVYGSAQGVQALVQASSSLMTGTSSDVRRMAFAQRAGITNPTDLILERSTVRNQRALVQEALREGGAYNSAGFAATLSAMVGPQQARLIFDALGRTHGNLDAIYNLRSAGNAPVDQRVKDYLSTPLAAFDRVSAHIENTFTKWGDNVNNLVNGPLSKLDSMLDNTGKIATDTGKAFEYVGTNMDRIVMSYTGWSHNYTDQEIGGMRHGFFRGSGAVRDIGPYNVLRQLGTPYSGAGKGITLDLLGEIDELTGYGYKLGIYDMNDAAHAGMNPKTNMHLLGRAMDIDSINGHDITRGGRYFALQKQFANDVLMGNPRARVGTYRELYDWLETQGWGNHAFLDEGSAPHIHVDVAPGGNIFTGPQGVPPGQQSATITTSTGKLHIRYEEGHGHKPNAGPRMSTRATARH